MDVIIRVLQQLLWGGTLAVITGIMRLLLLLRCCKSSTGSAVPGSVMGAPCYSSYTSYRGIKPRYIERGSIYIIDQEFIRAKANTKKFYQETAIREQKNTSLLSQFKMYKQ